MTAEVPGLAAALRPIVFVDADFRLTTEQALRAGVVLSDAVEMLALRAGGRTARDETRDSEDLWRCLEIAAADGVTPEMFSGHQPLRRVRELLNQALGPRGHALPMLTEGLQADAAA